MSRPFQPAVVGMTDAHQARIQQARMPQARPAKPRTPPVWIWAAAAVGVALLGIVALWLLRPKTVVPTVASSSAAPAQSVKPPLNINGVAIADGQRVDPTDLIGAVKSRLVEGDVELSLVSIRVTGARDGVVNLESDANASVVYTYVSKPRGVTAAPDTQRLELTLSQKAVPIARSPGSPVAKAPLPTCVWSAAWRSASVAGLAGTEVIDAVYAFDKQADKATWVFTSQSRPDVRVMLDGESCAIRSDRAAIK